jgi:MYXO-CTERM domain-containing protein
LTIGFTLFRKEKPNMRTNFLRQIAIGSLLLVGVTGANSLSAEAATQDVGAPADDDDGFNEGLLGLIGLAGLLGLRRKDADRATTRRV